MAVNGYMHEDAIEEYEGPTSPVKSPSKIKPPLSPTSASYKSQYFVQPIADIRGSDTLNYRKGEKLLRCKLATCIRLVDIFGWPQGISSNAFITTRLEKHLEQMLAPPCGLLPDEVTASSLLTVSFNGDRIIDPGCTVLGQAEEECSLHGAIYMTRPDLNCLLLLTSPKAIAMSVLKCGLLPLCQEAMILGEVNYFDYLGLEFNQKELESLGQSFIQENKILFLKNYGIIIGGESIEEMFYLTNSLMTAIETQLNLLPFGLENLYIPPPEVVQSIVKAKNQQNMNLTYNQHQQMNGGNNIRNGLKCGELEFEALVRQLDSAGYSTGYVGREIGLKRAIRSHSTTEITPNCFSILNADEKKSSLMDYRSVTPSSFFRNDSAAAASNKHRSTKWIVETNGLSKPRSSSVKVQQINKFAPQGSNPKELKEKVKEIRKEYFEDTITSGPQSSVLEGVTWDEARKIKSRGGADGNILMAASFGIIQRPHQREALFYKNYAHGNPFENVTDNDLQKYRQEVEEKNRPKSTIPPVHSTNEANRSQTQYRNESLNEFSYHRQFKPSSPRSYLKNERGISYSGRIGLEPLEEVSNYPDAEDVFIKGEIMSDRSHKNLEYSDEYKDSFKQGDRIDGANNYLYNLSESSRLDYDTNLHKVQPFNSQDSYPKNLMNKFSVNTSTEAKDHFQVNNYSNNNLKNQLDLNSVVSPDESYSQDRDLFKVKLEEQLSRELRRQLSPDQFNNGKEFEDGQWSNVKYSNVNEEVKNKNDQRLPDVARISSYPAGAKIVINQNATVTSVKPPAIDDMEIDRATEKKHEGHGFFPLRTRSLRFPEKKKQDTLKASKQEASKKGGSLKPFKGIQATSPVSDDADMSSKENSPMKEGKKKSFKNPFAKKK